MALREILAKFGFDIDQAKLEAGIKSTDDFATRVKSLADKLSPGGSFGGAVKDWIGEVKEAAGEFKAWAGAAGVATEDAQAWNFAAKMSGVQAETLSKSFVLLQKNAQAAAGGVSAVTGAAGSDALGMIALGSAEASNAFKALGINVKDASGKAKGAQDLMFEVANAMAKVKTSGEKNAIAMKLFGEAGGQMVPLLSKGAKGIDELMARFDELGGGVSEEAIAALSKQSKASKEYDFALLGLKSRVVAEVVPAMTAKIKALTEVVAWINRTTNRTEVFKAALIVLSGAFLYLQRQAIASAIRTAIAWAPTILLLAGLILLVDDVITAFKGGDSAVAQFLDLILGKGAGKSIFAQANKDVDELSARLDRLPDLSSKVEEVFSTVGGSIVRFFAEDIPEAWDFMWGDISESLGFQKTNFTGLLGSMFDYAKHEVITWAKDLAGSIADGVSEGLRNSWGKVDTTFTELVNKLKTIFKNLFQINSPSAVMEDLTGYLPQGSIVALKKWAPKLSSAAEETFGELNVFPDVGGGSNFAPTVKVQAVAPAGAGFGGPRSVDMRNNIVQQFYGVGSDVAGAARDGLTEAFDDERSAMLATLQPEGV